MVRPSRRREMAKKAVTERGVCIRVACEAFRISESCYRYERKLDAENDEVANWLIRLTDNHRNWGFGHGIWDGDYFPLGYSQTFGLDGSMKIGNKNLLNTYLTMIGAPPFPYPQ